MTDESSHLPIRSASQSRKIHRFLREATLNHGENSETTAQISDTRDNSTAQESTGVKNSPANISMADTIHGDDGHVVSETSIDTVGAKSGSTNHKAPRDEAASIPVVSMQEQREARRRRILAKGADRLAFITGDRKLTDTGGRSNSEHLETQGNRGGAGGEGDSNSRIEEICKLLAPTSPTPLPPSPTATSADFQPPSGSFTSGLAPSPRRQPRGHLGPKLPRRSSNPKPPFEEASQTAAEASPLAEGVDMWQRLVASQTVGGNAAFSALLEQLQGGQFGPDSANGGAGVGVEGSPADGAWQFNSSTRQVARSGTKKLLPAVSQSWDVTSSYRTLFTVAYAIILVVAANALDGSFEGSFLQPLLLTWPIGLLVLTQGTVVTMGALLARREKKTPGSNLRKGLGSSGVQRGSEGAGEGGVSNWGEWEGVGGAASASEGSEGDLMRKKMESMIGRIEGGLGWAMLGWKVICGISLDVSIFLVVVCCGFSLLDWVAPGSLHV